MNPATGQPINHSAQQDKIDPVCKVSLLLKQIALPGLILNEGRKRDWVLLYTYARHCIP